MLFPTLKTIPWKAYGELTKPRILTLVLVTTTLGYFLGGFGSWGELAVLLAGVSLVCGGSAALNHYLERDADAQMSRTKKRPLPMKVIPPAQAMIFGVSLVMAGVFLLWWGTNLLTAFLSLLTAFLYVLVYTPMKKLSWWNTTIGAIPGALPPMGGWAAATGQISIEAWVLFLILFFWQHPHFYAIAWMFREDYKKAGFKMLPVVEPDGRSTLIQINLFCILLLWASIVPSLIGMAGPLYMAGAMIAGFFFWGKGMNMFTEGGSVLAARDLLKASVVYLPILLVLIVVDIWI